MHCSTDNEKTSFWEMTVGLLTLCSQALLPGVPPTPMPAALTFSLSQDGEGRRVLTTAEVGNATQGHRGPWITPMSRGGGAAPRHIPRSFCSGFTFTVGGGRTDVSCGPRIAESLGREESRRREASLGTGGG